MSIRQAKLFLPAGNASPLLHAQWRNKVPDFPIPASATLVDGGMPTGFFAQLWRNAFPDRSALPKTRIANDDGTGTDAFWDVFK